MSRDLIAEAMLAGRGAEVIPGWTIKTLAEISGGRLPVTAMRHPLGFACLPMERVNDDGLCLHVWSPELSLPTLTTSAVHKHSWDLLSYILYGTLRNDLIEVTEPGPHRLFEVHSTDGVDEIRQTPTLVDYRVTDSATYHASEVYSLAAGEFHMTVCHGETATVAVGRGMPGLTDISLGDPDLGTHHVQRQRCTPEETAHIARLVTTRLTRPWAR